MSKDITTICNKMKHVIPKEQTEFIFALEEFIELNQNRNETQTTNKEEILYNILLKFIPNIEDLIHSEPRWKFDVRDIFEGNPTLYEELEFMSKIEQDNEDKYDEDFQHSLK